MVNLIINSHPKSDAASVSGSLARRLADKLDGQTKTIRIYDDAPQEYFHFEFNERWIAMLKEADRLIFPVPMWNFMIPAALKDFFDKITKQGEVWDMRDGKFVGLLKDRPSLVIMTSGGDYPPGAKNDFVTPYMKNILSFIGIEQVEVYRVSRVSESARLVSDEDFLEQHVTNMLNFFAFPS